jgi:uncharacterized membrane protein
MMLVSTNSNKFAHDKAASFELPEFEVSLSDMARHPHAVKSDPLGARGRLIFGLLVGLAAGTLSFFSISSSIILSIMVAWDVGTLFFLGLTWRVIFKSNAHLTKARATSEDPGRTGVFVIAIGSSLVSLFAAVFVLHGKKDLVPANLVGLLDTLAVLAVVLAWVMTHTAYALRYARLYYSPKNGDTSEGLKFPGNEPPDDLDFAYFSFVLGMAFQVSDVSITCKRIRRAVLWHSLQAFLYNTVILALSLNLLFGLFST